MSIKQNVEKEMDQVTELYGYEFYRSSNRDSLVRYARDLCVMGVPTGTAVEIVFNSFLACRSEYGD